jgi:hypothetical protein
MKGGFTGGFPARRVGARPYPSADRWLQVLATVTAVSGVVLDAVAQVPQAQTLNGPPVQVQPTYSEPGVPLVTINPGTVNPFSSADSFDSSAQTGATGSGSVDGTSTSSGTSSMTTASTSDGGPDQDYSSDGTSSGSSTSTVAGSSTALSTMLGTSWGAAAVSNAQALGVNPSALAATCVIESGCQNVGGSGSIAGAFQMSASTYTAMINQAVANDPSLASQIVPGLAGQMDPATESIAASEYLTQGAQALQNAGISEPTVLQVRGYYNFGPTNGVNLATADPSAPIVSVLQNVSATTLTANGITSGETVGQWQAQVAAKIGNAASQPVLT